MSPDCILYLMLESNSHTPLRLAIRGGNKPRTPFQKLLFNLKLFRLEKKAYCVSNSKNASI